MNQKYLIVLILLISSSAYTVKADLLRTVYILATNGIYQPEQAVSTRANYDILNNYWDFPGEVTGLGLRQDFLNGYRNGLRYKNFVANNGYNMSEWRISSPDFNRTLMSTQSFMFGFFPPEGFNILSDFQENQARPPAAKGVIDNVSEDGTANVFLRYPVFPLYVNSRTPNNFFYYNLAQCTPLTGYLSESARSERVAAPLNNFVNKYGPALRNAYGFDNNYINNVDNLMKIAYAFISGYMHGKTFNELTNQGVNLAEFNQTSYDFYSSMLNNYYTGDENNYFSRIVGSNFYDQFKTLADDRLYFDEHNDRGLVYYDSVTAPKIKLNTIPDHVMAGVLRYLRDNFGTNLYQIPPASSINFEFWGYFDANTNRRDFDDEDYYVNVIYNNNVIINRMNYEDFKSKFNDRYLGIGDINDYCYGTDDHLVSRAFRRATIALGIISGLLLLGLLLALLLCCLCCTRKRREKKVPVTTTVVETQRQYAQPVQSSQTIQHVQQVPNYIVQEPAVVVSHHQV